MGAVNFKKFNFDIMAYGAEQITEKGNQPRHGKPKHKLAKKMHHRRIRNKMKDLNYVPKYNRYEKGWVD